jgi:lipid-A-disaccharide synthase-like uncharacterized protein
MTTFWFAFGLAGQLLFASRFLVQWLASERARRSVVPRQFWLLSLGGAILLLTYAIHRRDPIFILGQGGGLVIYVRNMVLITREKRATESGA